MKDFKKYLEIIQEMNVPQMIKQITKKQKFSYLKDFYNEIEKSIIGGIGSKKFDDLEESGDEDIEIIEYNNNNNKIQFFRIHENYQYDDFESDSDDYYFSIFNDKLYYEMKQYHDNSNVILNNLLKEIKKEDEGDFINSILNKKRILSNLSNQIEDLQTFTVYSKSN